MFYYPGAAQDMRSHPSAMGSFPPEVRGHPSASGSAPQGYASATGSSAAPQEIKKTIAKPPKKRKGRILALSHTFSRVSLHFFC